MLQGTSVPTVRFAEFIFRLPSRYQLWVTPFRCSLDHLAVAAAKRNGRSAKDVSFPINADKENYHEKGRPNISKCSDDFVEYVDKLKPFRGGNDALFELHRLDIVDKHRILIPIAAGLRLKIGADAGVYGPIDFSKSDQMVQINNPNGNQLFKDGDTVKDFTNVTNFPESTKIRTEVDMSLIFGNETNLSGQEIRGILGRFTIEVQKIIVGAERLFFR